MQSAMHSLQEATKPREGRVRYALTDPMAQEAYDRGVRAGAIKHFAQYRRHMSPRLIWDAWFPRQLARELRQFYEDYKAGKRPILVMTTPPQHGKSLAVIDFISWVVGHNPDMRVVYTSFSDRLSIRAKLRMQRILDSPKYQALFPNTRLAPRGSGVALRNYDMLEFMDHEGYFRNSTVMGAITGEALDLGVVDDPIKGRAEANAQHNRDKVWSWLTDDVFSRFSDRAALLLIQTRWHLDDPAGRLLEREKGRVREARFPAIAEVDDEFRKKGEALFPQLKSLDFLEQRKKLYTQASWQSLYQCSPIQAGGGMFPVEKLTTLDFFDRNRIVRSVRYVDKAGTEAGGAYTAMVLMHYLKDKTYVIEHVVRGQWAALEREQKIKHWATLDRKNCRPGAYEVVIEQEPGSGGKESVEATIRNLAGFKVAQDKVTGSKEVRADPFAAQVQGGNVKLVAGEWHYNFLDELQSFPYGKYRDQTDAAAGAFNRLTIGPTYSLWSGAFD
jgi:predicted phage terminase large subunit-like protein